MAYSVNRFSPPGGVVGSVDLARAGPYKYQNKLYSFWWDKMCPDDPDPIPCGVPNCWKSLDDGETWEITATIDSDDWPDLEGANKHGVAYTRYQDIIYILWHEDGGGSYDLFYLRIAAFDLSSEQWTIEHSPQGPSFQGLLIPSNPAGTNSGYKYSTIETRPNGILYIFYTSNRNGSDFNVISYITYNPVAHTWGSPVEIKDDLARHHIIAHTVLARNKIHLFTVSDEYSSGDPGWPAENHLHHITLNATDVLQTYQTLAEDLNYRQWTAKGIVSYGQESGTDRLAIGCISDNDEVYIFVADETDDPSWTKHTIDLPDSPYNDWYTAVYDEWFIPPISTFFYNDELTFFTTGLNYWRDPPGFGAEHVTSALLWYTYSEGSWSYETIYITEDSWVISGPIPSIYNSSTGLFFWSHWYINSGLPEPEDDYILREYFVLLDDVPTYDFEDEMQMLDDINLRRSAGSLPTEPVSDSCPPIILDSAYCTEFKTVVEDFCN